MKKENLQWLSGPFTHLHLRHSEEPEDAPPFELRQFTHTVAIEYLRLLSNGNNVRITDTNHAMLAFSDLDNLRRPETEEKQAWIERLIAQVSDETLKRIMRIRKLENSNVIVGIEADIIDGCGNLNLNEQCLVEIDYVIASFHRFIWTIFSEKKRYTAEYLIQLYLTVLDNPYVSVLGHPTRVSSKLIGNISAEDYRPITEKMSQKRIALEVNVLNDLTGSDEELTREVVGICVECNTPLVLTSDFHHLQDIDFLEGLAVKCESPESELKAFFEGNGVIHFRMLRRVIRNIELLESLGVKKEMVVNNCDQDFDRWLNKRKELTSALRMTAK